MFKNILLYIVLCLITARCQPQVLQDRVCLKQHCFDVEVVQDDAARMQGLKLRKTLGENNGMLFIFPHIGKHRFWMKDTLIPLDIIWIDHAYRIVHVENDVPPCRRNPCPVYTPETVALYVLEVNAGRAKKLGLKKGDPLKFQLQKMGRISRSRIKESGNP